jgi:transketolase
VRRELPQGWDKGLPVFPADGKGVATRDASGQALNALATNVPWLIGGSADLAPSNLTWIKDAPPFQPGAYHGRNFHFGVREHAMGSVVNGMAVHGGVILRRHLHGVLGLYAPGDPPSALSITPAFGSSRGIGLGEDGPIYQPVEHLTSRLIPGWWCCDRGRQRVWTWKLPSPAVMAQLSWSSPCRAHAGPEHYTEASGLQPGYILIWAKAPISS